MKSRIRYSRFATAVTVVVYCLLFAGCIATVRDERAFFILLAIYLTLIVGGLLYGPAYVEVDKDNIILGSLLRHKKITLRDVESVELFRPTMGAIRIFASGGFIGYWGIFKEGDIGRYYAFYGKSSDCFLVRMKNGDKYVVGCENPDDIIAYVSSHIGSRLK